MFGVPSYAAVQAKVRARRSRLLTPSDWRRLFDATTFDRALDVLALTPHHADADDPDHAERALRQRLHRETIELADDVPHRAGDLLRWFASRSVVHDLKLLLRTLHHGSPILETLDATTLDPSDDARVRAWRAARSVPELIDAVGDTLYGRALRSAFERYQREDRPFYLEVALDLTFGRGLVTRIEALGGGDRADAERLLGRWLARVNLLTAARYRMLAGVRPEQVVAFTLHRDFGGGLGAMQRIAAGAPLAEEAAQLDVDVPLDLRGERAIRTFEREADGVWRNDADARFGRTPFGLGLPLAYLIELEAEVQDLVTLLEGKRRHVATDALRAHLPRGREVTA